MAADASNDLRYYLSIADEHRDRLAQIRPWQNLKVGLEGSTLWVRDFDYAQLHSVEVKSIPFVNLFYERGGMLFPLHSRLPERVAPSLLWTAIQRAFPIKLPSLNHNFFGIRQTVSMSVTPSDAETDATAMLVTLDVLEQYLLEAPAVRLEKIRWVLIDNTKALLVGTPLLPLPGETLWQRKDILLPTGFDFELFLLCDVWQKKVNPGRDHWLLWFHNNEYVMIPKDDLMPLSRSSFKLSYRRL